MERYVEKVMEAVHFQKSISFVNHDSFGMKFFFCFLRRYEEFDR